MITHSNRAAHSSRGADEQRHSAARIWRETRARLGFVISFFCAGSSCDVRSSMAMAFSGTSDAWAGWVCCICMVGCVRREHKIEGSCVCGLARRVPALMHVCSAVECSALCFTFRPNVLYLLLSSGCAMFRRSIRCAVPVVISLSVDRRQDNPDRMNASSHPAGKQHVACDRGMVARWHEQAKADTNQAGQALSANLSGSPSWF